MEITIPGQPIAKMRHRLTTVNGFARQYDPQQKEKDWFKRMLLAEVKTPNLEEKPLAVDLIFKMDAFKGATKAETAIRLWYGMANPTTKPDLDNLEKFSLDCGNGILWPDDRFIVRLSSKKIYAKDPCTIISITPIVETKLTKEQQNVFKTFSPHEFNDLQNDLFSLYQSLPKHYFDHKAVPTEELASAASILIDFSNKWADKLKKIRTKHGQKD